MKYHGGPVVSASPKVYLVFWGSQWGTQSTSGGYEVFSGDPLGMAQSLQAFFAGLGTNNELWSAAAIQYCDGVALNLKTCAYGAERVAYPSSPVLAGVWEDTSLTPPIGPPGSPTTPGVSATQIAQEAQAAAAHFGDTSTAAQYVIVSPTGADPDGWASAYCAYHNDTATVISGPDIAYTNLPYVTDLAMARRFTCSAGLAASPPGSDAITETAGHEYYETLTDGFGPAWYDARGNEIGDKCEISAGLPGGPANIVLSTGTFAVQTMWANDANNKHGGCVLTHTPILVGTPTRQISVRGAAVALQLAATDVLPGQTLTYAASGLPPGLTLDPSTGLVSGIPTTAAKVTVISVTVTDNAANTASTSFKWLVKAR